MYIRFVIFQKDDDSHRFKGVYQAADELIDDGVLTDQELRWLKDLQRWLDKRLDVPSRFSRSTRSGAHKNAFPIPDTVKEDRTHPLWATYECDPGSLIIFTESCTHSGTLWSNKDWDRVGIFNGYNALDVKYHDWEPHPEQLAEMPPMRQTLFRDVRREMAFPEKSQESRVKMRGPGSGRGATMKATGSNSLLASEPAS